MDTEFNSTFADKGYAAKPKNHYKIALLDVPAGSSTQHNSQIVQSQIIRRKTQNYTFQKRCK